MADLQHDIERYLSGKMTAAEMHALEKAALSDPFLADALEGGSSLSPADLTQELQSLQAAIHKRVAEEGKNNRGGWWWRIAAALLLLGASSYIIYNLIGKQENVANELALNQETPVVSPTPADNSNDTITGDIAANAPKQEYRQPEPAAKVTTPHNKKEPTQQTAAPQAEKPVAVTDAVAEGVSPETEAKAERTITAQGYFNISADSTLVEKKEDLAAVRLNDADLKKAPAVATMRQADVDSPKKKVQIRGYSGIPTIPGGSITAGSPAWEKVEEVKIVHGKVTDADDGLPLPGVSVSIKGASIYTVTDLNGNYELRIPESTSKLVFTFVGLETKEADAENEVNVQMTQDISQLSEVVVIGYGTEEEEPLDATKWELAEPDGGRKEYKKYLEKNLLYPELAIRNEVEGKVTVQFTIQPSGELTDFRVVKSLGYGCDEEVIRLIKAGPQWKPTRRNDEPVKGKAKVKMRFSMKKKE